MKTNFPEPKYLVYYGELFSVLSWQTFKAHFQIIIFSQFASADRRLRYGPACFCYVSCSLETKMNVINKISVLSISSTLCVSVGKSKLLIKVMPLPPPILVYLTYGYSLNFIE